MAQFIGYVRGGRGEASRIGHKTDGLTASAQGYDIGGKVVMTWDEEKQRDVATLYLTSGSNGMHAAVMLGSFTKDDIADPERLVSSLRHAANIIERR